MVSVCHSRCNVENLIHDNFPPMAIESIIPAHLCETGAWPEFINSLCEEIHALAESEESRFAFAESCSSGLAAATIGAIPGISQYFCGSKVTYRDNTKHEWLAVTHGTLSQYSAVSEPTADEMVAGLLTSTSEADIGIAITGHLGPDAPSEIDGHVFAAVGFRDEADTGSFRVWTRKFQLNCQARGDRQREAASLVLWCLRQVLLIKHAHRFVQQAHSAPVYITDSPDRMEQSSDLLFPGAFNPIHDGHREMAEIASTLGDQTVVLEVSIENVDKPTLSQTDCICRILPLLFEFPVLLTAAATFVEKSYKNNITFVVGADTIARIGEDRYYNDEFSVDDAISVFSAKGTRFVVFGREMSELQHTGGATKGHFQSLKSLNLPSTLTELCHSVEESSFRNDLSSKDLR